MTYRITGLDPQQFRHLVGASDETLSAHGAVRMIVDGTPGFPCRLSLDDREPGETVVLVNHVSHDGGPYHASHAIFIGESVTEAAHYVDAVPPALDRRVLSLRAFGADGMMVEAALVQPGDADPAIRALLANPAVEHIDAHNAVRGCFAARIVRA
jgi:hypothetical protein